MSVSVPAQTLLPRSSWVVRQGPGKVVRHGVARNISVALWY